MPALQVSQKKFAIVDCLELAMKINASGNASPSNEQEDFESSCSAYTPPLDLVTLCSEDCSDDVSSVSSCSISEDPENDFPSHHNSCTPSAPRSIFSKYWGSQDHQSHKLHRPLPTEISAQIIRFLAEDESPSQNVYEETLREREETQTGLAPKRRSIFNNQYKSNSTPTFRTQKYFDLRKIQSTSALGNKPTKSCLRPSRYSGTNINDINNNNLRLSVRSAGSDNSVRFSEKVEVTVFQSSVERYAEEGWSDFFAYR